MKSPLVPLASCLWQLTPLPAAAAGTGITSVGWRAQVAASDDRTTTFVLASPYGTARIYAVPHAIGTTPRWEVGRHYLAYPAVCGASSSEEPAAAAEPSLADIQTFTEQCLRLQGPDRLAYRSLSGPAQIGYYHLLLASVPRDDLVRFLTNPATTDPRIGGAEAILRLVGILADLGVIGFARAFQPMGRDGKFLSNDPARIYSLLAELHEAGWLKANTEAVRVEAGARLALDWSAVSPAILAWLETTVIPDVPSHLRDQFRNHSTAEVDLVVEDREGFRVVEVKTSLIGSFSPTASELAILQLQIIRQSLLRDPATGRAVRGLEYVIRATQIDSHAVLTLRDTLLRTGLPFVIRLEGGRERRVIEGGLSYAVVDRALLGHRTRPLPPIPIVAAEPTDTEAAAPELPWTPAIRRWLGTMVGKEAQFSVRHLTLDTFRVKAQHTLRVYTQKAIATRIREWLASAEAADLSEATRTAIRAALVEFLHRPSETLADTKIDLLVTMAALATQPSEAPEEAIEEGASDTTTGDIAQGLVVERRAIETAAAAYLPLLAAQWTEIAELFADEGLHTFADLSDMHRLLEPYDPDAYVLYALPSRTLTPRATLALMRDAPFVQWNPDLSAALAQQIDRFDTMVAQIAARRAAVAQPVPRPLTQLFEPIPPEELRAIRDRVLALGALPARLRQLHTHPAPKPSRPAGPPLQFDPARVTAFYRGLILVHPLDEDVPLNEHRYYFPEDLAGIEVLIRSYLRRCGWDEVRIEQELPALRTQELQQLGGGATAVESRTKIIPERFERSDRVTLTDRFTGKPLDVTRLAETLVKGRGLGAVADVIRVVVMADRRRVYFVDRDRCITALGALLFQMPQTVEALMQLLTPPPVPPTDAALSAEALEAHEADVRRAHALAVIHALRQHRGEPPLTAADFPVAVVALAHREDRIASVRVVPVSAAPLNSAYAKLHFAATGHLSRAVGHKAFDVALSHYRLSPNAMETHLLSHVLGTQSRAQLTQDAFFTWLRGGWSAIYHAWRMLRRVDPSLPDAPPFLILMGANIILARQGPTVHMIPAQEAATSLQAGNTALSIHCGGRLATAIGVSAVDSALHYLGIPLNSTTPIEKSLVSPLLGTRHIPPRQEGRLTVAALIAFLQEGPAAISRAWSVLRRIEPERPEQPSHLYLSGQIINSTQGLTRLQLAADDPSYKTRVDSGTLFSLRFIRQPNGRYALDNTEPLIPYTPSSTFAAAYPVKLREVD